VAETVTPLKKKKAAAPRRRRWPRLVVPIVVLAIVALVVYFRLYVSWLWFDEVDLTQVFWTSFWWRLITGAACGALFFAVFFANVEVTRRLSPTYRVFEGVDVVEFVNEKSAKVVRVAGLSVAIVGGLLVGLGTSSEWLTVQTALHAVPWGADDPLFGHDYSFYVFKLPLWHLVHSVVTGALAAALVFAVVAHAALGGIFVQRRTQGDEPHEARDANPLDALLRRRAAQAPALELRPSGVAIAHVSVLLGLLFLVGAVGSLFRAWNLLNSSAGVVAGAGYTDVHARLPGARVTLVVALAIAVMLFVNAWRRRWRWPLYSVALWIVVMILVRGVWPAAIQSLVVNPTQQEKEKEYIAYNIAATRSAYNLDKISQDQYPLQGDLTPAKLQANEPTLRNIRLWDPSTLLTSYRQLQELRPYYLFADVDVDRYTVNGVYRETMLSARELNIDGLPQQAQTWVNQHITYTHGFGAVVSAVNQVTPDGSPDFLVKDVPPVSKGNLAIDQPRIYYGELGTDYTLVKTSAPEFDYPGSAEDVFAQYEGDGGIAIGSTWRRLAFSVRFGTIKFLTTSYIDGDSRIIMRNNIRDRLKAAAPFLSFDADPYMVIADGRLYWVADAYTSTDRYPYSQPQGELNYVRNPVKAVIDAYDGTMVFYTFDESDPMLRTYAKVFPDMFKPADEVPPALLAHIRYPEEYFNVQSEVFATYHVTEPDVLYNKGNQWQIPDNVSLEGGGQMHAYYVIMRLPGADKEEFLLMLPYVPNGKSNMIAWLGARSDVPEYGSAVSFDFPSSSQVYGPSQVEGVINQDTDISEQFTLWGTQGSEVIMGNLLIIPIEDSLLYVQPVYLQSSQTALPQLKRVIVFYRATTPAGVVALGGDDQRVVMKPTLGESLAAVFGSAPAAAGGNAGGGAGGDTAPGGGGTGTSTQVQKLVDQANGQFQAAQEALKAGDWAEYGRQIDALETTLKELQGAQ
jgi:uncharacterized membrane protein (UPF0182 family)